MSLKFLGIMLLMPSLLSATNFSREVLPILADKCFHCHGPDANTRKASLRLDIEKDAKKILKKGRRAIVPGKSDESGIIQRIMTDDEDDLMPPADSHRSLTKEEKATLTRWVDEGAEWGKHWAFEIPQKAKVSDKKQVIDTFVIRQLAKRKLKLSKEASKATLIRRLSLDLRGLPPTPREVKFYMNDKSGQAYEKLVDRLLASSAYGERMAWDWMNAARFSDTNGFQADPTREMWPWRDWVVKAFNDNMPYDQFTIEQIAGDLLPNATAENVLATAFNRNHTYNGEGGRIAEETRVENVMDRAETVGTVWLGLTFMCCKCHDHKYDPISEKEYYQFYDFFNQTSEKGGVYGKGHVAPIINFKDAELQKRAKEIEQQRLIVAEKLKIEEGKISRDTFGSHSLKYELGPWSKLGLFSGVNFEETFKKSFIEESTISLTAKYGKDKIRWQELSYKDGSIYRFKKPNAALYVYRSITTSQDGNIDVWLGSDDCVQVWVNGKTVLKKKVFRGVVPKSDSLTLPLKKGVNHFLMKVTNNGGQGGFYFLAKKGGFLEQLKQEPLARQGNWQDKFKKYFKSKEYSSLLSRLNTLSTSFKQINKNNARVMVMDSIKKRRKTRVLSHAVYDAPKGEELLTGTPSVLPALEKRGKIADRLDLARWLTSTKNPLPSRVTVNRIWQMLFGRGLVKTSNDFGVQGSHPTHPDLLDYLAVDFMENGWDLKKLIKQIVMSRTYRQSSKTTEEHLNIDPLNLFFARAPRYRLPSWMLRDQALAASGLLNTTLGGPAVRPYQPVGLWAEATFGKIRYKQDKGAAIYRRSLYVFWRRIIAPPMFFDNSDRLLCEVTPKRTNTPLHALTVLNETSYVEAGRSLAQNALSEFSKKELILDEFFRLILSRKATVAEKELLSSRHKKLVKYFSGKTSEAKKLLAIGQLKLPAKYDTADLASWSIIAHLMLNLDETLNRE